MKDTYIVPSDIAFWQSPELVTLRTRLHDFLQREIHPRVAVDQVAVECLAVFSSTSIGWPCAAVRRPRGSIGEIMSCGQLWRGARRKLSACTGGYVFVWGELAVVDVDRRNFGQSYVQQLFGASSPWLSAFKFGSMQRKLMSWQRRLT